MSLGFHVTEVVSHIDSILELEKKSVYLIIYVHKELFPERFQRTEKHDWLQ